MVIVSRVLEINCGFAEEISKTSIMEQIYSFDIFWILHGILQLRRSFRANLS